MQLVGRQQPFSISFSRTPNQFPFPHGGGSALHAARPGLLAEGSSHTGSRHTGSSTCNNALSGTLGPECALSLLSPLLHRPSAAGIPTNGQPQVASSLSRIAAVSQAATTAMTIAFAASVGHHVFVPDAMLEDPSQALPFSWQ
ncbi:unnamed protein product [Miscanthus lutarioriparius]|uniref:Uncharacterized protein n=1 Tax=Miscanthus lutarioriparius TaxID=422564 RepID=A0A811QLH1_9POAL|nr:unnamed protein product [Miscanthus lutarioriparius]